MRRHLILTGVALGLVRSGRTTASGGTLLAARVERAGRVITVNFRGIVRCETTVDPSRRTVTVFASGHDPVDECGLMRHLQAAWADELNAGGGPRVRVRVTPAARSY